MDMYSPVNLIYVLVNRHCFFVCVHIGNVYCYLIICGTCGICNVFWMLVFVCVCERERERCKLLDNLLCTCMSDHTYIYTKLHMCAHQAPVQQHQVPAPSNCQDEVLWLRSQLLSLEESLLSHRQYIQQLHDQLSQASTDQQHGSAVPQSPNIQTQPGNQTEYTGQTHFQENTSIMMFFFFFTRDAHL